MNGRRERLLVSILAGLAMSLSGVDSWADLPTKIAPISLGTGFIVLSVYALELAIANGLERAKTGRR